MTTNTQARHALLREQLYTSRERWMTTCRELDRAVVAELLDQVDGDQWAYSTTMDRAYRLETHNTASKGTPEQQDVIAALLGARVVMYGHFRYLAVEGWPPRIYVPMLFITSVTGRAFRDELRGER